MEGACSIMAENIVFAKGDGFYLSYLSERSEFARALDNFCYAMGRPEPKELSETALCVEGAVLGRKGFFILYGDHREAYKAIASQGAEACMAYFLAHLDQIGHSSDMPARTMQ